MWERSIKIVLKGLKHVKTQCEDKKKKYLKKNICVIIILRTLSCTDIESAPSAIVKLKLTFSISFKAIHRKVIH